MPKVDQGQFTVKIDMPAGTQLDVTNSIAEKIEKFFLTIPEVESVSTTVGSTKDSTTKNIVDRLNYNQAVIVVTLKKKRKLKTFCMNCIPLLILLNLLVSLKLRKKYMKNS